ncbi:ModD protein [Polaromonas naphthalenivorans]|uniref:Putative pyrophosphorylase ModD n=1 Tax=Polaromonas naphthalenivorans (strain CJ2) TaxID=365044 RepID=A1VNX0_POLNA|nr:ModD protein [Polaromonas naphthalenivorans]ABM37348.1 modD protein [Polaromonas naphthalenivorans CJ2]
MRALNDTQLCSLLDDDTLGGDLTTHSLGLAEQPARLEFRARQPMTVCASEEALRLFELAGSQARLLMRSGSRAGAGELILEAQGDAASLHLAWKTAQNLVEWASGIASATAAIVAAAGGVAVACTRKNVPGTKALSIKAVRAGGGGIMHRLGLSETLLVFAEHRLFLTDTPAQTIAQLRRTQPEKKIIVEVGDPGEALRWALAGADVLQLEKFTPEAVATCREALQAFPAASRPLLAAAGGVRAGNASAYVAAGADLLVTSAPYTAPPQDVQVTFFVNA